MGAGGLQHHNLVFCKSVYFMVTNRRMDLEFGQGPWTEYHSSQVDLVSHLEYQFHYFNLAAVGIFGVTEFVTV